MRPSTYSPSPRRYVLALAAAILLLAVWAQAPPSAAAADLARCTAHPLPLSGVFVSATQTVEGDLLIADYENGRMFEVGLPSGSWGVVDGTAGEYVRMIRPSAVHRVGEQLWLERSKPPRGVVTLGPGLQVQSSAPPRPLLASFEPNQAAGERDELRALWAWTPINANEIAACGRLIYGGTAPKPGGSNWRPAFVRYSLDDPGDLQVLETYSAPGQLAALACRLGLPVIASLGDTVFILSLADDGAVVLAASPGDERARPLDVVPERFAKRLPPEMIRTENPHFSEVTTLQEDLSRQDIPVGLFAWEDALYLLSRGFDQDAGRSWWLTRIRVAGGEGRAAIEGTVRLGSQADHLMVVPGDRHWALIEKGPVDSYRHQAVQRVITVPAERLRSVTWERDLLPADQPSLCGALDPAG